MTATLGDDRCRSCGGPLQILDASRAQAVTCVECSDTYDQSDPTDDEWVTARSPKEARQTADGGDALQSR